VDNNYLDLGINKSGFVHTLPGGRLTRPLLVGGLVPTESISKCDPRHVPPSVLPAVEA
jgi:hypothetical protein